MEENGEICIKCQIKTDEPLRVCETGIPKLQEYTTLLKDDRIEKTIKYSTRVHIHPSCQKNIGNSIRKGKNETKSAKGTTKSKIPKIVRWRKSIFKDDLDIRYIWDFIAFPVNIVLMEPKKPNLPLPSVGEIFLQPFEDKLCR